MATLTVPRRRTGRRADGGAAALGCAVHFVDHLPTDERPHGLRPVLDLVGLEG